MTASTKRHESARPDTLYRHAKRDEWGLAILAWDRAGRRAYQFEDGELRIFADGFQALMRPVDKPLDVAQPIVDRLVVELAGNDAVAAGGRRTSDVKEETLSVADQVLYFRTRYEAGFLDLNWRNEVRGVDAARRLKRHREPAIAEARELLSAARLDALLSKQRFGVIHSDVVRVLEGTDLATPAQVRPVKRLDTGHHQALARAVRDVLYGERPLAERFGRFSDLLTKILGRAPSWPLATALPALVHPESHLAVRAAIVRVQCKSMAPQVQVRSAPSGSSYERLVAVAEGVVEELRRQGLEPRDLMDIQDFMAHTLSPKARKQVEALRRSRVASEAPAVAA